MSKRDPENPDQLLNPDEPDDQDQPPEPDAPIGDDADETPGVVPA